MLPLGLIAAVIAVTCLAGVLVARWLQLDWPGLRWAGRKTLEMVGMGAIFFGANLVVGMALIAAIRALSQWPVSHYILGDVTLPALSLLQGMVYVGWQTATGRPAKASESFGVTTGRD